MSFLRCRRSSGPGVGSPSRFSAPGGALLAFFLLAGCSEGPEPDAASGHDHDGPGDELVFGHVSFPVSCDDGVREGFDRGVALLHSFYFTAARRQFEEVAEQDPECAMAHWGLALTYRGNVFAGGAGEAAEEAGLAAAERARELGPPTEREALYVEAALALFDEREEVDFRTRMIRYEEVLERLARENPDDPEAAIFYARALIANAPPADRTFERQLAAVELLDPLFEQNPRHPGLAHYIIHAYDVPELAERGLEAAYAYADIAPDAPHALHMPSHIFTRLGYWDESIETNRRSADADDPNSIHRIHAWDYKVYGFLQQGRDEAALEVLERARELSARVGGPLGYNAAAMEARYVLERERWAEAAALEVRSSPGSPAEAVTRFARGIGAVRSGDVTSAAEEASALARIRDELRTAGEEDWAERTEAQRLAVVAWVALADGEAEEAVAHADRGASIEERVEKHPVTPGPLLPARELHGDLLMELGRYADALAAYAATLEREPNRARTLASAARAAEAAGESDLAVEYHRQLAEVMEAADTERPELARAREVLGDA